MRAALLTVAAASLVLELAALAAGIVGTNGAETIRGTAGHDRISGRGGNDVLVGNGGRDVVDGGRGADRLSLRDGERDTAICGPGRDVVLADSADVVLGDCEILRVVPPEPVSPPPRPVVPGLYAGRTTQGQLVTFQVSSGGNCRSSSSRRSISRATHPATRSRRGRTTSAPRPRSSSATAASRSRSPERDCWRTVLRPTRSSSPGS